MPQSLSEAKNASPSITVEERNLILVDVLLGREPSIDTPEALDLRRRLEEDLAELPPGTIVDVQPAW